MKDTLSGEKSMLNWLKRGIARYDQWCERLGLVPENRRCCAPVRYDEDDPRHPSQRRPRCVSQHSTHRQE
ncbi:DUF5363 domain-containing protein [Photobacterium sp. TY1-4]|uniref:DUF5363 domain-containing protein n=1 Tax=Photobacterium sp. TY1-4 TaxID=2899122 RepID=UPI0021BFFDB0|nr:DUF5363 domain-containing protein [Photobacterium sp. TY1-4]UXI00797.1 DUF5363 domain-containing protein [Photobacterium sp. TY1-4]